MPYRVHIERRGDFGRQCRVAIIEYESRADGNVNEFSIVPIRGGGGVERRPLVEGQRITEDDFLMTVPEFMTDAILQAFVVELTRHGFISPDPHGTRVSAIERHVATLEKENDRHFELVSRLVDAVTTQPGVRNDVRRTTGAASRGAARRGNSDQA